MSQTPPPDAEPPTAGQPCGWLVVHEPHPVGYHAIRTCPGRDHDPRDTPTTARQFIVEAVAEALLLSDAMTGDSEGTPSTYHFHRDNVEYLVKTVLDFADDTAAQMGWAPITPAPPAPTVRAKCSTCGSHLSQDGGCWQCVWNAENNVPASRPTD